MIVFMSYKRVFQNYVVIGAGCRMLDLMDLLARSNWILLQFFKRLLVKDIFEGNLVFSGNKKMDKFQDLYKLGHLWEEKKKWMKHWKKMEWR